MGNQSTGKRNQTVRDQQAENDHDVGVNALCTGHLRIAAGGSNSSTENCSEEPVHDRPYDNCGNQAHNQGGNDRRNTEEIFSQREDSFCAEQRDVRFAHDHEINGVKTDHGQNAGKQCGDLEFGGQKCGDRTADAAGNQRNQHGEPNGVAGVDQGGGDGSTERKRAFNGQVRDIQDAEGKEDAEGHDGPQQTLRNGG